uniref:Glyco_hydro_19_cat domain-containing protein n=1 Tax=Syphacia muris TaxID=451379 RepID=A0A158R4D3_9BILA
MSSYVTGSSSDVNIRKNIPKYCPPSEKYGDGPARSCKVYDPNDRPKSAIEYWFTRELFNDLFPKANLGWGPHKCFPYSYEAFIIAARYFPEFGTTSPNNGLDNYTNTRRDVAAFFAHAIQETGENDANLYNIGLNNTEASNCFYRGGFFNWFEGGPVSMFLPKNSSRFIPESGKHCQSAGRYCANTPLLNYFYPCESNKTTDGLYTGCYFGRGAIQISYNYNYGQFQNWLQLQNISVNLLENPNLILTKMNPPLAIMASLWFYMTPQPPKPAMHDIILGTWNAGKLNSDSGYSGPIFGPTSLIINNECGGEDVKEPGGPGENRRIKAFKWFCKYFEISPGKKETLSCKNMPIKFESMLYEVSYQPDWSSTWKEETCKCAPATYQGVIPYFHPDYYSEKFTKMNEENKAKCVQTIYSNPSLYSMDEKTSRCLKHNHISGSKSDNDNGSGMEVLTPDTENGSGINEYV